MLTSYDPTMKMVDARARYFEVNHFGQDGGYNDAWVDFKLGPLPMPFPNTAGRVKAVGYHDMHHVVTGYDTNTIGEFEISAWEIGAGCRDVAVAWVLNLSGMAGGLFAAPIRTFRAFVRGRRMETLYGRDLNVLLATPVGKVRVLVTRDEQRPTSVTDVALFTLAMSAGLVIGTAMLGLMLVAAPIGLLTHALRPKAAGPKTA